MAAMPTDTLTPIPLSPRVAAIQDSSASVCSVSEDPIQPYSFPKGKLRRVMQ
ncbi:hypothetical protein HDU99_000983, partial [Rhizoclosmatium hyalinum]